MDFSKYASKLSVEATTTITTPQTTPDETGPKIASDDIKNAEMNSHGVSAMNIDESEEKENAIIHNLNDNAKKPGEEKKQAPVIDSSAYPSKSPETPENRNTNDLSLEEIGTEILVEPTATDLIHDCDFDRNPTELYEAIQAKQFEYALDMFQMDGEGQASDLSIEEYNIAVKQAKTWVSRYEADGKSLRWRMLCLHASLFFSAPSALVKKLLEVAPSSVLAKDDQGMLPLHLAFKYHGDIDTILHILELYPQGIFVEDKKGRTPLECYSFFDSEESLKLLKRYSEFAIKAERDRALFNAKHKYEAKITAMEQNHKQCKTMLQNELNEVKTESQGCRTACYNLIAKNEAAQKNEENLMRRVNELTEENNKHVVMVKEMDEKIVKLQSQLNEATNELYQVKERNKILEPDHVALQSLKKSSDQACKRADVLEKSNTVLRKTIEDMKENAKALAEERDNWRRDCGVYQSWKTKAEQSTGNAKDLQEKLHQMTTSYREILQEKQESDQKMTHLLLANEVLHSDVEELGSKLKFEQDEKETYKTRLAKIEATLESNEEKVKEAESHRIYVNEMMEMNVAETKETVMKLEYRLHNEEELNLALKTKISSFLKDIEFHVADVEKKLQERNDVDIFTDETDLSAREQFCLQEKRDNMISTLEEKIHKSGEKLRSMKEKKQIVGKGENAQGRDDVEPNAKDVSKSQSHRDSEKKDEGLVTALEEKMYEADAKLRTMEQKMQKINVDTLGTATDYIRSMLDYLSLDHEYLMNERDLWKLKTRNLQSELNVLQDDYDSAMKALEAKIVSRFPLCGALFNQ